LGEINEHNVKLNWIDVTNNNVLDRMEGVGGGGEGSGGGGGGMFEYFGWVYHLGINTIGHEYCHLRFLFIRGKFVSMYKRDPHQNPGIVCISI
jgi:hypothetical protein